MALNEWILKGRQIKAGMGMEKVERKLGLEATRERAAKLGKNMGNEAAGN